MNSLATVSAAVLVVVSLPVALVGMTLFVYSMFTRSERAAHVSHGLGVVSMAGFAVGLGLLGVYLGAGLAVVLAVVFARWWWLTRPAPECAS